MAPPSGPSDRSPALTPPAPLSYPATVRTALSISLLVGCTGGPAGGDTLPGEESWRFALEPVLPLNQSELFSAVTTLELRVEAAGAEPVVYTWEDAARGAEARFPGLDDLAGATLELRGYDAGGTLLARGRTAPIDASAGAVPEPVPIFLAGVERVGVLGDLASERVFGRVIADGAGGFLLLGGTTNGVTTREDAVDDVARLDLLNPEPNLAFQSGFSALPPVGNNAFPGRAGFTATPLSRSGDAGQVLISGGTADGVDAFNVGDDLFLLDPLSGATTPLDDAYLPDPLYHHTATEDAEGRVIFVGSISGGTGSPTTLYFDTTAAVYDPVNRRTDNIGVGSASGAFLHHGAARLGDDGVLACGGADLTGSNTFEILVACDLFSRAGVTPLEGNGQKLLLPTMYHAMATLPDGRVLSAGGVSASSEVDDNTALSATAAVFAFDGDQWAPLGELAVPRAMHTLVPLPDGRFLVAGGVTRTRGLFWDSRDAIGCVEIFDPTTGTGTILGTCDVADGTGSLPLPVSMPMVAVDPSLGVLIVGGLDTDDNASTGVAFVGLPPAD